MTSTPRTLDAIRVLLVDDDDDTRELYAFALEQSGAEVKAVADVEEALRIVVEWAPSILVSDLVMPGSDGAELVRSVRAHPETATLPAIAVTGRSSPSDREAAKAAGFQALAAKPLLPEALVALVKEWAKPR